jgi:phage-related tail protein
VEGAEMKRESKYASCLNALDEMQQSVIYAARKGFLAEAESIIVRLESETAEQRQIIDEQVEENRGFRSDVLLMQKEDAAQRAEIDRLQAQLATAKREVWTRINDRMETKFETKEDLREWVRHQKEAL